MIGHPRLVNTGQYVRGLEVLRRGQGPGVDLGFLYSNLIIAKDVVFFYQLRQKSASRRAGENIMRGCPVRVTRSPFLITLVDWFTPSDDRVPTVRSPLYF